MKYLRYDKIKRPLATLGGWAIEDFCCEKMEKAVDKKIIHINWQFVCDDSVSVYFSNQDGYHIIINYCPFCAEKVEMPETMAQRIDHYNISDRKDS